MNVATHVQPGLRGFISSNLFRMFQFYETGRNDKKVSALLTLIPRTSRHSPRLTP